MKVSELIKELSNFDPDLEVGVVVSYKDPCNCAEYGGYCYCSYEDHEHYIESVNKQEEGSGKKKTTKVWIRGE